MDKSLHLKHPIPDTKGKFEIHCGPSTDLWDKPPSTHSDNAPMIYQTITKGTFKSIKVNFSAEWKTKYDQGGLCLMVNPSSSNRKWIKTGIEYVNDEPHLSTVVKDRWADWSLRPLAETGSGATIEMENAEDGSLWIYAITSTGQKSPLREVTWWGELEESTECWVGPFAAKPAPGGEKEDLIVQFEGLKVITF